MKKKRAVAAPDITLGDLSRGMPGITSRFGASLAEAATICLEEQAHQSGVHIEIDGDYNHNLAVHWQPIVDPEQARRCWADPEVTTEHGAYGVASLLVCALTNWTVLARSRKGTGFDYWLGPKDETDPLFQNKARLEVTGIAKGTLAEIGSRSRKKLKQTEQSDGMAIPALIAVVEFGAPRSRLVNK